MSEKPLHRPVRSFVIRSTRMTYSQQKAFDAHWPEQGLDAGTGLIDQQKLFARKAPLVLEVGFGMGASLAEMAANHPETDFIGIEVHKPGVGALFREMSVLGLNNLKVFWEDAKLVIDQCLPDHYLDRIQIFFPDPWHKRRHHKRRLIQEAFVLQLRQKLKTGGVLHMATDWEPYARQMLAIMQAAPGYQNLDQANGFSPRPDYRPITKFEKRGQRLGHGVWDLLFERVEDDDLAD